ncbi:hypothetical protein PR202_ga03920 [Eleusine coracana subsp. coracana]|uniref:GH18 domain-containing protein n=1 Tax=Eleusine coracana subsp. coracana TaxID=191504 RepID=A0AAV5BNB0_ELECO|nr:hypothetical protein QOZ80_5AG0382680 [Eleusine coracana subsp. coracana]GJM87914.1 hypothetical protein PR202_ga03920 [Eleusine coracana subsp. coracana]
MALQGRSSPLVAINIRSCSFLLCFVVLLFFPIQQATAGKTGQLTVYWGRNKAEGSLREACDTGIYNTVIISFFSVFGHGKYWTDLSGHPLNGVGNDIKHCQSKKHVTVLLSIGGDGEGYSLPTAKSARDVADHLWNAYLGGHRMGVFRPFGDAVLDGIDFYIGLGPQDKYYDELARSLVAMASRRGKITKQAAVHLTASPPCSRVFDEQASSELETMTRLVERVHVRFYGEPSCGYDYHETRPFWGAWSLWRFRFPATRLHVALPASDEFRGWIDAETLRESVLPSLQDEPRYGGVVLWNRYHDKITGYGHAIRDVV